MQGKEKEKTERTEVVPKVKNQSLLPCSQVHIQRQPLFVVSGFNSLVHYHYSMK